MIRINKIDIFVSVFLIVSIFAVYFQLSNYDFVNYDDNEYVTENEFIKKGINTDSITWALTHSHSANWHPLTWISHMVDYALFGLNAGWHHVTNIVFHLFNALLLYAVFRKMTGTIWPCAFIASLFALHPLHVESVAWISERKDVLSTFWGLLTILLYIEYVQKKNIFRFSGVLLFFSFSLMSKSMLVTLPLVLLLLDYWPLQRLQVPNGLKCNDSNFSTNIGLLLEKTPLIFLSFTAGYIVFLHQQQAGAIRSFDQIPLLQRSANVFVVYINYIYKTIYPINLAVLYPYKGMPHWWEIVASFFIIIGISFFAIRKIKSHPYFFVGWSWFLGTLLPVIGIVQVGDQLIADRYTYIPLTGLFIIIAWGMPHILSRWRNKEKFLFLFSILLLMVYMTMSWKQASYWKNGLTLSRRAVSVTSGNYIMENNLANMLAKNGRYWPSIVHYIEALRIKPNDDISYHNMLSVLRASSNDGSLAEKMKSVLSLYPVEASLCFIVGKMYRDENEYAKAIEFFKKTIRIDNRFAPAYYNLSKLYLSNNMPEASITVLKELTKLEPDLPDAYIELAHVYRFMGNDKKASECYQFAINKGHKPLSGEP